MSNSADSVNPKQAHITLITLTLLYAMAYADRTVLIAVLQPMKDALGLSDTQAGMLQTAMLVSVALLMIPMALLVDRWSRRKAISLMAILWSTATLATGLAGRFSTLLTARFMTGFGEAGYAPGGASWLSLIFPEEKRSKVMGLFNIGIPLGSALGVALGGYIAVKSGSWRTPFFVFAAPGVIFGLLVLLLPDPPKVTTDDGHGGRKKIGQELKGLFRKKSYVLVGLGFALFLFVGFGIGGWIPTALMREYGMNEGRAGAITGLMFIVGAAGAPLGGMLADRWQRRHPAGRCYFLVISSIGMLLSSLLLILLLGGPLWLLIIAAMAQAAIGMTASPSFMAITQDVAPPENRAAAMAVAVNLSFLLGGAWGPAVIGALSDLWGGGAYGVKMAWLCLLPSNLPAGLLFYLASRHYPGDSKEKNT